MASTLDLWTVTAAIMIWATVSYLACIATCVSFDWSQMYKVWMPLLPGFTWPITFKGVAVGLAWLGAYSVSSAALLVFVYNYIMSRSARSRS